MKIYALRVFLFLNPFRYSGVDRRKLCVCRNNGDSGMRFKPTRFTWDWPTYRRATLEYFRNMSPQVLLIATAAVYATRFDGTWDIGNFGPTLVLVALLVTIFVAWMFSLIEYFGRIRSCETGVEAVIERARRRGFPSRKLVGARFRLVNRSAYRHLFVVFLSMVVVEVVLVSAVFMAVKQAAVHVN